MSVGGRWGGEAEYGGSCESDADSVGDDRFVGYVARVLVLGSGFVESRDLKRRVSADRKVLESEWTNRIACSMTQMDSPSPESDTSESRRESLKAHVGYKTAFTGIITREKTYSICSLASASSLFLYTLGKYLTVCLIAQSENTSETGLLP